jgi:hypothetical protein
MDCEEILSDCKCVIALVPTIFENLWQQMPAACVDGLYEPLLKWLSDGKGH